MTEAEVYHDVYPVWTYSYLSVLIVVFLCTDLAKYKPVIILEGFAYILTWVLLTWGWGLTAMQMMQVVSVNVSDDILNIFLGCLRCCHLH